MMSSFFGSTPFWRHIPLDRDYTERRQAQREVRKADIPRQGEGGWSQIRRQKKTTPASSNNIFHLRIFIARVRCDLEPTYVYCYTYMRLTFPLTCLCKMLMGTMSEERESKTLNPGLTKRCHLYRYIVL